MIKYALGFSSNVSSSEIRGFLASPDDRPIVIWTMQGPAAVECLESTGELTGDPRFIFGDKKAGKRLAYEWLREIMTERLTCYQQEWPVWALLTQPPPLAHNPEDVLLRLEIPKARFLVSFYEGWVQLLGIMEYLEQYKGKWPEAWIGYRQAPLLTMTKSDEIADDSGLPVPIPHLFDEEKCRSSWKQIFDLDLYQTDGFTWDSQPLFPLLQAIVPKIYRTDVTDKFPLLQNS